MSMHLENPGLTLAGKKKGKKKFASADAKHKAKSLDNDWNELMRKYEAKPLSKKIVAKSLTPIAQDRVTSSNKIPSLVTPGGDCNKVTPTMYTGDKVLGIAIMHKSNLVPIFSDEEAVAVSSMRR